MGFVITYYILMSVWASVHGGIIENDHKYHVGEGKTLAFYESKKACQDAAESLIKGLGNGQTALCISYTKKER
jgi:hypothetical protein